MTRLEIKDFAAAAPVGRAAWEHIAPFEPADKNKAFRCRHIKMRPIHLFLLQIDIFADAFGNRMARVHHPEAFLLARFAPFQVTAGAHELHKDFGHVAGMQHDQPHSLQHTVVDTVYDFVANLLMGDMPPPYQHIRIVQYFLRQPMLRFIQSCSCSIKTRLLQKSGYLGVDTLRIYLADTLLLQFMTIFIPYGYSCHYGHTPNHDLYQYEPA